MDIYLIRPPRQTALPFQPSVIFYLSRLSVVEHCRRLCKYGHLEFSFVVPRWWNELPSTTRAGASLSTFKKLLKTQLFREHLPSYLALRLVLNLHLQQLHSCTSFSSFLG